MGIFKTQNSASPHWPSSPASLLLPSAPQLRSPSFWWNWGDCPKAILLLVFQRAVQRPIRIHMVKLVCKAPPGAHFFCNWFQLNIFLVTVNAKKNITVNAKKKHPFINLTEMSLLILRQPKRFSQFEAQIHLWNHNIKKKWVQMAWSPSRLLLLIASEP